MVSRHKLIKPKASAKKSFSTMRISSRRTLGYSATMKQLISQNRGVLLAAFFLLKKNLPQLVRGATIRGKKNKIRIKKMSTGSYAGAQNLGVFKIIANNRTFFVKLSKPEEVVEVHALMNEWEQLLAKHQHRAGDFRVEILKPHLVYSGKNFFPNDSAPLSLLVFDFLEPRQVTLDVDTKEPIRSEIHEAFREIESWHSGLVPSWGNTFFQPRGKKLLLFDLTG